MCEAEIPAFSPSGGGGAASICHVVTAEENGLRLQAVLRGGMSVSASAVKGAKWAGRILVDGLPRRVNQPVFAGEVVCVRWGETRSPYAIEPLALPLDVAYEDASLLIVNKPAPMACQTSLKYPNDALENALFWRFGCPADFVFRPVNRLDKGTSGLMVVAKTAHCQQLLQKELHTPALVRTYLAVVVGAPPEQRGIVDAPIRKAAGATVRREVGEGGKPSVTEYEVLAAHGGFSLVKLSLRTGRTHQIRVHMAYLDCPVAGDFLYGEELAALPGRFALHAWEVRLQHPLTGETIRCERALPAALAALLGEGLA